MLAKMGIEGPELKDDARTIELLLNCGVVRKAEYVWDYFILVLPVQVHCYSFQLTQIDSKEPV